jgi:hypothetical protein
VVEPVADAAPAGKEPLTEKSAARKDDANDEPASRR